MSKMTKQDVASAQKLADAIELALKNAMENGYEEVDEDSGAVAEDMAQTDADLEGVPLSLMIPHIERWQKIQRIKRGGTR